MTRVPAEWGRAVVAGTLWLTAACGGAAPAPGPEAGAGSDSTIVVSDDDAAAAGIVVAQVEAVERRESLGATGVVSFDERRTARIGALVDGVIAAAQVQPGDRVPQGAVLASIHSHTLHDAWANYFRALADRQRLDTELTYATSAESRAAQLVADKALSPQELERVRADAVAVGQLRAAAVAEVTRAEQELRHYGLTPRPDADPLEHDVVPVVTPIAGVVVDRLTSPGAAVTPGTPLFVVSDLSRVWVAAEIDEALLGRLTVGGPVEFTTSAYGSEEFSGTLAAIGDVVSAATRRVTLRVTADNLQGRLKPGMFVNLTLHASAPRRVLVVPSGAVQSIDGESVVFVRTGNGAFERRSVSVAAEEAGQVVVERGLSEGESVAVSGAFLLKSELARPLLEDE